MKNKHFFIPLIIYITLSLLLYPFFQYNLNPDGIVYISIAKKYFTFNWELAINGTWGPMLSILFIPALLLNVEPIFYIKFVNIILGILLFWGLKILVSDSHPLNIENNYTKRGKLSFLQHISGQSGSLNLRDDVKNAFFYAIIIPTVYFTYWVISPDFLLLVTFIFYIGLVIHEKFLKEIRNSILIGVLGALLYYIKSYGFPFFLLHFSVLFLIGFVSAEKKDKTKIAKYGFLVLLVFSSISSFWIINIHEKYDKWGISSANNLFLSTLNPKNNLVQVYLNNGIIAPPDSMSIAANEDPSLYDIESWNPFGSSDSIKYYSGWVLKNILKVIQFILVFSPFVILLFFPKIVSRIIKDKRAFTIIISMILYSSGYIMLFVETRYVWQVMLLGLVLEALLISELLNLNIGFLNKLKGKLLILFIISAIPLSVYGLSLKVNYGKDIYEIAEQTKIHFNGYERIASNDKWLESYYLSYHNDLIYYGKENRSIRDTAFVKKLRKEGVNYHLYWGKTENIDTLDVLSGKIKHLQILKVD